MVTADEFINAAVNFALVAPYEMTLDHHAGQKLRDLLLAAAEQREQLDAARANAELQSYGRRLAEDNQIRAYRLQDEALKERDEALTAMASAMATIAGVIEWAEKNDYGKEADGDLWRILKSYDTSPASNPLEKGPSDE